MALNLAAFREPRGVMRVLQFVFAICAFATTSGYDGSVTITACQSPQTFNINFGYPFQLDRLSVDVTCKDPSASSPTTPRPFLLQGDFSSDAQFFVATGVLAFLYCIGIVAVYALFEEKYQSNSMLPLADFVITTILAVFWLSSSAAWANGLSGLKTVTDKVFLDKDCKIVDMHCTTSTTSFSGLNISIILGFLNFFLWASDLWFLYKETHWFKMRQDTTGAGGV